MTTPRLSPTMPLPPLLALPLELKQQILSYLSDDNDLDLSLTILRRTHPILRHIIPHKPLAPFAPFAPYLYNHAVQYTRHFDSRRDRSDLLFFAELYHPYLFLPGFYPCYDCGKVLDKAHFQNYRPYSSRLKTSVHKPFGSTIAHERKCNECLARVESDVRGLRWRTRG